MIKQTLTAAALAFAAPLITFGAASPAAAQSLSAEALRFGELYLPAEMGLQAAIESYDASFYRDMRAAPGVAEMEKQFPGLIEAAAAAGRTELTRAIKDGLPAAQASIARFAEARFTRPELIQVNEFLASGAGQRMLLAMSRTANTGGIEAKAKRGDTDMSGADLSAMANPVAALASLSSEDRAAVMKFNLSAGGRKMASVENDLANTVAGEMTIIMTAMKPNIETAVVEALTAHVSKGK